MCSEGLGQTPELEWNYIPRLGYQEAWHLQEEIRSAILHGGGQPRLLLLEHPRTITLGRGERGKNLGYGREELQALGFSVLESNRGGLVTYHGPGQLVAYPILHLRQFGMGVKDYVRSLEETMIQTLKRLGIEAQRKSECPGAWVENRKIGSLGIHVRKQVSIHGLALNVSTQLTDFSFITPCGISDVVMTSIVQEGIKKTVPQILSPFRESFARVFGCGLKERAYSTLTAPPLENQRMGSRA